MEGKRSYLRSKIPSMSMKNRVNYIFFCLILIDIRLPRFTSHCPDEVSLRKASRSDLRIDLHILFC